MTRLIALYRASPAAAKEAAFAGLSFCIAATILALMVAGTVYVHLNTPERVVYEEGN